MPGSRRATLRHHGAVFGGFVLLTAAFTYPLVLGLVCARTLTLAS